LLLYTSHQAVAQAEDEKLDLPGDNLNLYAVLKLFQESETLEGFERKLNEEDSEINNLDLDGNREPLPKRLIPATRATRGGTACRSA